MKIIFQVMDKNERRSFRRKINKMWVDLSDRTRVENSNQILSSDIQHETSGRDVLAHADEDVINVINVATSNPELDLPLSDNELKIEEANEDMHEEVTLEEALRKWVIEANVSQIHVTNLLRILNTHLKNIVLPKTVSGLLNRPSIVPMNYVSENMNYCGLRQAVDHLLPVGTVNEALNIDINFDGISFFKSSRCQCWPILGRIKQLRSSPFLIGVYYGKEKPKLKEYVNPLVLEINDIIKEGNKRKWSLGNIRIICDAPARSLVKGTKYQSGYHSCDRCMIEGEYCYDSRSVIFVERNCLPRTDETFRNMNDHKHHNEASPLVNITRLNMIKDFPIDSMHCVYLGVVRKMMKSWITGNAYNVRLSSRIITELSSSIRGISSFMPSEFLRRPRGLDEIQYWKASEYRTFLLYVGIVVMRDNVSESMYYHFLVLHCAITLLCQTNCKSNIQTARILIQTFMDLSIELYGPQFLVYNVHSLLHIPDDCELYGPLDNQSAFPFENFLQIIKNRIKSGNKVIEQVTIRSLELLKGQATSTRQSNFIISTSLRDKCVICNDGSPAFVEDMVNGILYIRKFTEPMNFFDEPFQSSLLGIVRVDEMCESTTKLDVSDVISKACALPYKSGFVVIPVIQEVSAKCMLNVSFTLDKHILSICHTKLLVKFLHPVHFLKK